MEKETVKSRYTERRPEVQEYMSMLLNSLEEKHSEIPEHYIVSLDMLALNLEVLFKSVDELKEKGMTETDKYRGEKKSGALQAFFNSQNYIHKILGFFGFTPSSKSKIRENSDKQDVQKFLEELTK